jgi:hypothetical protein
MTATRQPWEDIPHIGKLPEDMSAPNSAIIAAKRALIGGYGVSDNEDESDLECHITDAITDLRHLCDALGFDFAEVYQQASEHYDSEINEEEADNVAGD